MRPLGTLLILVMLVSAIVALAWVCFRLPNTSTTPISGTSPKPAPVQPITNTTQPAAPIATPDPVRLPDPSLQTIVQTTAATNTPVEPPSVAKPVDPPTVAWKTVYKQSFDTKDTLNDFLQVDGGELQWHEKHKALYLKNDGNGGQIYAALRHSLPGDLRVRMRVLRTKDAEEINIGLLFNIRGSLKGEDGYFAEWKMGEAQIKRNDDYKTGGAAATPATEDRWVQVELTKIGGQITMRMQDREVASWTDPKPYRAAYHDLFSLYVWDERTLIDDLTIERNENDPVKPMHDDPGVKSNAIDGIREDNNPNPDQF